jgi:hypothetical protein
MRDERKEGIEGKKKEEKGGWLQKRIPFSQRKTFARREKHFHELAIPPDQLIATEFLHW